MPQPMLEISSEGFTPAEAARIAGVSVDQQRNWRRYGYLIKESRGKHARYNSYELAAMIIMQKLSERGIGPGASNKIALLVSAHVIYHAILYACLTQNIFEDKTGLDSKILSFFTSKYPEKIAKKLSILRYHHSDRFFIWLSNGKPAFANDITALFNDLYDAFGEEYTSGACVVIDIRRIASALVDRAERPLFIAELAPDDATDVVLILDIASMMKDGGGDG